MFFLNRGKLFESLCGEENHREKKHMMKRAQTIVSRIYVREVTNHEKFGMVSHMKIIQNGVIRHRREREESERGDITFDATMAKL